MEPFKAELKRYLNFLKLEKGLSELSTESYEHDLRRYLNFLYNDQKISRLDGVEARHIEAYLNMLTNMDLAVSTISRNISSIRGFHSFAVVEKLTESNPAELIELPQKARTLPAVLTADEVNTILQTPDRTTPAGIRDAAIMETLYATGMRVSELVALPVSAARANALSASSSGCWSRSALLTALPGRWPGVLFCSGWLLIYLPIFGVYVCLFPT